LSPFFAGFLNRAHGALALSIWLALPAAVTGQEEKEPSYPSLAAAADDLAAIPGMAPASYGICLLELGETATGVFSRFGNRSLIPASTVKLLTTGTALEVLGPDFSFETRLRTNGSIDQSSGTLKGDLLIEGSGDPLFARYGWKEIYEQWTRRLTENGIKTIDGAIVGDDTAFSSQHRPGSWAWADLGNYYGAGATGLNFNRNLFHIYFRSPGPGGPTRVISRYPNQPEIQLFNEVRAGAAGSGDQAYVYGATFQKNLYLRGTVPPNQSKFSIKAAIPDPALFAAQMLKKTLTGTGITHEGTAAAQGRTKTYPTATETLASHRSGPLKELILSTNHKSINLNAECLLKTIGRGKTDRPGSVASGTRAVEDFMKSKGIPDRGLSLKDGSGLSRANLITPRQLAGFLKAMHNGTHAEVFKRSLPVAGKTGTLKSIAGGSPAEGRIRGKSGTLSGIKCYAGYARARSGKTFAFALMINHYDGSYAPVKRGIVKVLVAMANL
ncbi:MAG: D-alanyl-D-alanine carboxypeptidase/D-alanyl-D-alanine-endopeptidase, partial [Verrucomicrobiota bacterium]